eukprot:3363680-Pyramimonas_sp.AAC.1
MATSATADTILRVAMIVAMVAMTTARPITAPKLTTPADVDDALASAMKALKEFDMRARPTR